MKNKMWAYIIMAIITLAGGAYYWRLQARHRLEQNQLNPPGKQTVLFVGRAQLMVERRLSDNERALGLSYRRTLGPQAGMLFEFPSVHVPTFWMKDMEFNLDMIWIKEGRVVEITRNVPAPKNAGGVLKTVTPQEEVNMVLEVNAGWADKNGIQVGDEVKLDLT